MPTATARLLANSAPPSAGSGAAAAAPVRMANNGAVTSPREPVPHGNGVICDASSQRLFSFGICTDVQYADLPQGESHGGRARYYRDSLQGLHRAVQAWKSREADFGMHLGDLVDGKNPRDRRDKALNGLLSEFNRLGKRVYHIIGNHCLYNFSRAELNERLDIPGSHGNSFYSFSPHEKWRFVVLDSYDISMLGWPPGHSHHEAAREILDEQNINEEKNNPDGMEGLQRRFVKFGGGVSNSQLEWLQMQLAQASQEGQRVVVFCHQPIHPDSATPPTLVWNFQEVMHVLQRAGNVVAAFSGHAHMEGYASDECGIHFRVLGAILETPPGRDCYGFVDVYEDRLELVGVDFLGSSTLKFRQQEQPALAAH